VTVCGIKSGGGTARRGPFPEFKDGEGSKMF
jgi:hypothetical protein